MSIPNKYKLSPVDATLYEEYSSLCDEIENSSSTGIDPTPLIEKWNTKTHIKYELSHFMSYYGSMSKDDFVKEALLPSPEYEEKLDFKDLLEIMNCIVEVELEEFETSYYLNWFDLQFPYSNVSDLIYYPDIWFQDESLFKGEETLTNDQIIGYLIKHTGRTIKNTPENLELPFPIPDKKRNSPILL